jgi:hypothetical protein
VVLEAVLVQVLTHLGQPQQVLEQAAITQVVVVHTITTVPAVVVLVVVALVVKMVVQMVLQILAVAVVVLGMVMAVLVVQELLLFAI